MPFRHRVLWTLVIAVCVLLLTAPALWNHFPLLQWDTGGYLARWYEGTLVPSRAVVYGLILTAGAPFAFWPVVVAQAGLTVWVVALMLRAHGLGKRPLVCWQQRSRRSPSPPPCPGSPPSCSPIFFAGSACWRFICC